MGNFASNGATQTFTGQIDTTSLPSSAYQTTFGVELNLVADKSGSNNEGTEVIPHDLVPVNKHKLLVTSKSRGDNFPIEAKATFNDGVDTNTSFITFDEVVSPTGMDQWIGGDMIVGGEEVFQEGTSNEHRQYLQKPSMNMGAVEIMTSVSEQSIQECKQGLAGHRKRIYPQERNASYHCRASTNSQGSDFNKGYVIDNINDETDLTS